MRDTCFSEILALYTSGSFHLNWVLLKSYLPWWYGAGGGGGPYPGWPPGGPYPGWPPGGPYPGGPPGCPCPGWLPGGKD